MKVPMLGAAAAAETAIAVPRLSRGARASISAVLQ